MLICNHWLHAVFIPQSSITDIEHSLNYTAFGQPQTPQVR